MLSDVAPSPRLFDRAGGLTSDAEPLTRPHPEGRGLRRAMEVALRGPASPPSDVGYLNPHATSTSQETLQNTWR